MSTENDFVPFCPTDTGTNLPTQAAYLADPQLAIGNQTGIARSILNNKALRQATVVASQIAQVTTDQSGVNILDDGTTASMLAQMTMAFTPKLPVYTLYTTGSGTYYQNYIFFLASGNATASATYTNNGHTFTVSSTISAGSQLMATGTGAPTLSGVLTKASGTGDATITFYCIAIPSYLRVRMLGGGGGGAGSSDDNSSAGAGVSGTQTSFGSSTCGPGTGAPANSSLAGSPGSGAISGGTGLSIAGGYGQGGQSSTAGASGLAGGMGASTSSGPGGGGGGYGGAGSSAVANSGGGGGGAGVLTGTAPVYAGAGGGSGAFVDMIITSPAASYSYVVGPGGAGGSAGTSGAAGGPGGSGFVEVTAYFQ